MIKLFHFNVLLAVMFFLSSLSVFPWSLLCQGGKHFDPWALWVFVQLHGWSSICGTWTVEKTVSKQSLSTSHLFTLSSACSSNFMPRDRVRHDYYHRVGQYTILSLVSAWMGRCLKMNGTRQNEKLYLLWHSSETDILWTSITVVSFANMQKRAVHFTKILNCVITVVIHEYLFPPKYTYTSPHFMNARNQNLNGSAGNQWSNNNENGRLQKCVSGLWCGMVNVHLWQDPRQL